MKRNEVGYLYYAFSYFVFRCIQIDKTLSHLCTGRKKNEKFRKNIFMEIQLLSLLRMKHIKSSNFTYGI